MERGVVCTQNYAVQSYAVILPVHKIIHYKLPIKSGSKLHISIGHETCMATVTFFSIAQDMVKNADKFNTDLEYKYCDELTYDDPNINLVYFALLELAKPVYIMPKCLVIASKLDIDVHTSSCRLAFSGNILLHLSIPNYRADILRNIKVYKIKRKEGIIDRIVQDDIIVKNMFQKESNLEIFTGLKVTLSSGEIGKIKGHFGQTGKLKVTIDGGLNTKIIEYYENRKKKCIGDSPELSGPIKVVLEYKSYIFDKSIKLRQ